MIYALKSELRKLLSTRSTYVICSLAFLLVGGVLAFYVEGYWGESGSAAGKLTNGALTEIILNSFSAISVFVAIVSLLQVVHEYRHNTIAYTLTAANSRTKALIAKFLVLTAFTVLFAALCTAASTLLYLLAVELRGGSLPAQIIDWPSVIGRGLFYNLAYGMIGIIIAYLARNIAAAIALLLIVPTTVEPMIGLLLKSKAAYLPFAALERVIAIEGSPALLESSTSVARAIVVATAYLVGGFTVTWYLFLHRDAN